MRELLPELVREEPAGVHAQVHGRRKRHERRRVLGAPDVRDPDLHRGLAAPALTLHRRRHHEAPVAPQRPLAQVAAATRAAARGAAAAQGVRGGQVERELAALGRGDGGVRDGDGVVDAGDEEVEAVAEAVRRAGAAALAPALEAPPGLPRAVARGAEDEPRPRVRPAHAVRPRRGHERRHHGGQRHGGAREVVHRHGPPLALLARRLPLRLGHH